MYGCSSGAACIGNYTANYSEEAKAKVDGVSLLSCPWDIKGGERFFFEAVYGIY